MTVLDSGRPSVREIGAEESTAAARLGQYLRARRELTAATRVGLSASHRVTTGLRPQEVAQLVGISPEHYERLEQGSGDPPSRRLLSALARALGLDRHATDYLMRLGRDEPEPIASLPINLDPVALLAPWAGAPAFVLDATQDVLAANTAACRLSGGLFEPGGNVLLRLYARGPDAVGPSWAALVETYAAAMRFHASPDDLRLHAVVGELSLHFPHFRQVWARHEARPNVAGRFTTTIDPVGPFELEYQCLGLPAQPGCSLIACYVSPGSRAEPALAFVMAAGA